MWLPSAARGAILRKFLIILLLLDPELSGLTPLLCRLLLSPMDTAEGGRSPFSAKFLSLFFSFCFSRFILIFSSFRADASGDSSCGGFSCLLANELMFWLQRWEKEWWLDGRPAEVLFIICHWNIATPMSTACVIFKIKNSEVRRFCFLYQKCATCH